MNKISKQKLFMTTILLTLLLISSTLSLMPGAKAATASIQEKTNLILNNILNIDTAAYSTKLNTQVGKSYDISEPTTDITLKANGTSVRISATYIHDSLHLLYLSEYSGSFAKTKTANDSVAMAKDFLTKYQAYTGDSLYNKLASTLNDINVDNNTTKTANNLMLKITNADQKTIDYAWTYVDEKGITAPSKNIVLSYDQGRLKLFLNNWPLYKIADVQCAITKEQAVKNALSAVQNFTYQIDIDNVTTSISVAGFQLNPESLSKTTIGYVNCPDQSRARNSDTYTLYPCWNIPLGFNKAYPGDVTGVAVRVWADTGKIAATGLMTAEGTYKNQTLASKETSQGQASLTIIIPIAFGAILCSGALIAASRRASLSGVRRLFNRKLWTALFCLTIVSSLASSTVTALPVTSSRIYASLDGTPGYPPGSPPQVGQEHDAAIWVCNRIWEYTYYNDPYGQFEQTNKCEGDTTKSYITYEASYDETYYDRAMVFHFGHLADEHDYLDPGFVDNTGTWIKSEDIRDLTTSGKHRFVFLWVCSQTQSGVPSDMAYAWLHDLTGNCFIGFSGASPQIGNDTGFFPGEPSWDRPLKDFIDRFYYSAIVEGKCISQSIDDATVYALYTSYTSSVLSSGYTAWFQQTMVPDYGWWGPGQMHIIGDSSIHLVAHDNTLYISSTTGGYTTPAGAPEYIENSIVTVTAYPDTGSGYAFDHWIYDGWLNIYENPVQVCMSDDITLTPVFVQNTYTTTINCYQTWGGSPDLITYMRSYNIQLPYGSNYLDFGGGFMSAYNYADSSTHYSSADWYWTGTGTSIDVLWTY